MKIDAFDVNEKVLVIAEIGNNHEGRFENAREMIALAAESGADAVKFQTFKTEQFIRPEDSKRFEKLKSFELSYNEFEQLSNFAKEKNLLFLATPLDMESAGFLNQIVSGFKIASGDTNFYPMIKIIASTGKPVIVSTGITTIPEIKKTKKLIEDIWKTNNIQQQLAVLHCVSSYPVPPEDANLSAIKVLKEELDCVVGYSDHTLGIDAAIFSIAMGARIIEKHFTMDKNFSDFPDHKLSADPEDLRLLVKKVENFQKMYGSGAKVLQTSEQEFTQTFRRSISLIRDKKQGDILTAEDLTWLRPGSGIKPGNEKEVIGKKMVCNGKAGEHLTFDMVE